MSEHEEARTTSEVLREVGRRCERPTHAVYRIASDLRYQETPCWCPARATHSILDTQPARAEASR